jgi:hypothetical protein
MGERGVTVGVLVGCGGALVAVADLTVDEDGTCAVPFAPQAVPTSTNASMTALPIAPTA